MKLESTIGIVGCGAAGLSMFVQLVDACIEKSCVAKIRIFEKQGFGRGAAYSTPYDSHILNLDTHAMTVAHTKEDDFHNWFVQTESDWKKRYNKVSSSDSFPPRRLFGDYLELRFQEYCVRAKEHGIEVELISSEVTDITHFSKQKLVVQAENGGKYDCDNIVLCIGNLPSDLYKKFKTTPGYYHSPWQVTDIPRSTNSIVILGTRLTAIDAALLLLCEKKYANKVYMVSRSGQLPRIIGPSKKYSLKYLTEENLKGVLNGKGNLPLGKLVEFFKSEIELAEGTSVDWSSLRAKSTPLSLASEIALVEEGTMRPWQSVLIAFYSLVPWVWSLLSDVDKKQFLKKYMSLWLTYLAAFPVQNAKRILELISNNSIEVVENLRKVQYDKKHKKFLVTTTDIAITADILINATGSGHILTNSQLLTKLTRRGLITADPAGGISIERTSCQVYSRKHAESASLYAIGEITFGDWLATADLGQVSRQAGLVTNAILATIKEK